MPTVTNRELPEVIEALKQLAHERLPIPGALAVRKLYRAVAEHWEDVLAVREQLVAAYARHDPEGRVLQGPDGTVVWHTPEDGEEAERRFADLMAASFTHSHVVTRAHLGEAGALPAAALIGLGPFFADEGEGEP